MQKEDKFAQLMEKYQTSSLSKREYAEFIALLNSENRESLIQQASQEDWSPSKDILKDIQDKTIHKKKRNLWTRWTIAASVLLLIALYVFWPVSSTSGQVVVYTTPYGQTQSIQLPDGSEVLLNANSTLTWDSSWEETGRRHVSLEGEAFFDVLQTPDKKSFVVDANKVKVRVLGTRFNVRSRNYNTDIFLQSGKVDLSIGESEEKEITMVPGDYIKYNENEKIVEKNGENTLSGRASWVSGMLEFENKYLPEILQRFEELYGVHFAIANPDLNLKRMDLSLPYSNWDLIKQALEISLQVNFSEQNDTILVK
ncbi:FecR family protein [Membranihabitans marinus]|uniref:FecR family protein n=1 Tax=Membranihabitans marinus TaxID=1227546 RepID=UPI001F3F613A|nr:FecR domain-containing protein [Membranihabitans marinus]